jgi:hypothetical protein
MRYYYSRSFATSRGQPIAPGYPGGIYGRPRRMTEFHP